MYVCFVCSRERAPRAALTSKKIEEEEEGEGEGGSGEI
jgi:hypothetical protein